jgi:hypothetical protein
MSEIVLVDLPCKGDSPHCWSLNPWKARAALNYKNLPYKTEWIEYPDLASTLSSRGVPKNDGSASYTDYSAPAANLPGVGWVMDSRKIGEALDKLQPMPKLHMERGDVIDKTQAAVLELFGHLRPEVMPRVPPMLLNPRSAEYFEETRAKRFGMSLADLGKSDLSGEVAWKNAEPSVKKLADILKEKPGDFVLGEEVSFSDFVIGGMFIMLKSLDKNGDLYDRLVGMDDALKKHCQSVAGFFEKDN